MTVIGFTGSRMGMVNTQKAQFAFLIGRLLPKLSEFHHGDCVGSDVDAHNLMGLLAPDVPIHIHPPMNGAARAFLHGEVDYPAKEYLKRNRDIVKACDILIATPLQDDEMLRSGTWSTIRYARNHGRTIYRISPKGVVYEE